jgi:formate dehydrogenase maturation protein FdhE
MTTPVRVACSECGNEMEVTYQVLHKGTIVVNVEKCSVCQPYTGRR